MSGHSSSFADLSSTLADMVAVTAPQIVEVQSHRSLASGFFWRPNIVVTAEETLADGGKVAVELHDGTVIDAAVIGRDPATDIALLRVDCGHAPIADFSFEPVRAGELTLIVGAAESAPLTAFGTIAAVGPAWQSMRGGTIAARIELDLQLRQRIQGGLALTGDGRAIGMAVRGPRRRTLIIPAATIERIAGQIAEYGRVAVAYIGVALKDVPLKDGGSGSMVMTLDHDGPAAVAGLQQGDIIVSWQGTPTSGVATLLHALRAAPVGSTVTLALRRGGAALALDIMIGDKPAK